jgi:prophage DNA circulation protein
MQAFVSLSERLSSADLARDKAEAARAAQSLADARVGALAALGERAGRAEADLALAEAMVDKLAVELARLRDRAEAAEAEALLLREQAAAAEARAAATEARKALLRTALIQARRPWWRRWMG